MSTGITTDLFADVASIDWNNLAAVTAASDKLLTALNTHRGVLRVTAEPYTTSLVVRGPAVKDRFLVTDRVTGQAWWQYGAATESPDDAARKRMSISQATACLQQLTEHRILTWQRGPAPRGDR